MAAHRAIHSSFRVPDFPASLEVRRACPRILARAAAGASIKR
jgi:hypothetical protein